MEERSLLHRKTIASSQLVGGRDASLPANGCERNRETPGRSARFVENGQSLQASTQPAAPDWTVALCPPAGGGRQPQARYAQPGEEDLEKAVERLA